jgi:hypothetical protein
VALADGSLCETRSATDQLTTVVAQIQRLSVQNPLPSAGVSSSHYSRVGNGVDEAAGDLFHDFTNPRPQIVDAPDEAAEEESSRVGTRVDNGVVVRCLLVNVVGDGLNYEDGKRVWSNYRAKTVTIRRAHADGWPATVHQLRIAGWQWRPPTRTTWQGNSQYLYLVGVAGLSVCGLRRGLTGCSREILDVSLVGWPCLGRRVWSAEWCPCGV